MKNKRKNNNLANFNNSRKTPKIRKSDPNQDPIRFNPGSPTILSPTMEIAEEIRAGLSPDYPSFSKPVHRSNVAGRFCLYMPKEFCDEYLPARDESIILEDEDEQDHLVKYVLLRNKLDGGWRGFANQLKLKEGDAMVFHLIEHCRFKVYIVRAPDANGFDGFPGSDFHDVDQSVFLRDILGQSVPEDVKPSKPPVPFTDVKCIEDFEIRVNGVILEKIPAHLRRKYYDLCCSQAMYLHDYLLKGLNNTLAVGVICETANIASAIRAANLPETSLQDLTWWDNTLEALQNLGMTINFLRGRLQKLIKVASKFYESKKTIESKRKLRDGRSDEFISFDATLLKAKVLMDGMDTEVEALEAKNVKVMRKFAKLAGTPW